MKTDRTYWFGPKRFGIGYGPRSWQGWAVVVVYALSMVLIPRPLAGGNHDVAVGTMVVLTIAFLGVFLWKLDTSR